MEGFFFFLTTIECCICSVYISDWIQVESQKSSPVVIQHPLGQMPAKVEVQVKIHENGNDVIFPAFGSAQRDDDSNNDYGGVVYFYNERHVKIFVPVKDNHSEKGVLIYTGGTAFAGPFQGHYSEGLIRVKVWGLCDLPPAKFTSSGSESISTSDSYKTITHELGRTPDFVVVQLKMTNGYVSEATGVTFSSQSFHHQTVCGTVFAFNDQEIRLWSMSGTSSSFVACVHDGWGTESITEKTASIYIKAWILDSCNKYFSTQFTMDKNNINPLSPSVERVNLDLMYDLNSTLVSVLIKLSSSNNDGFIFHAGGSAMIDTSNDPYGAVIYGYNETEVMLWRPAQTNTNGHLVYVGGQWGAGQSNQQSDVVEVVVKVIDITGTPCNGTERCSPDWPRSRCISTDCPIPPDIGNAYKLYEGLTNGSKALYSCKTGYTESSDDVIINCVDGTWSMTSMFCKAVCTSPPAIENAAVFVQDNRAKYYCLTGYFAIENTVDIIECSNRIWPSPDFKCIKSCPDPPSITNANVMVSNNVALYSCLEGFLPKSGTSSIKCLLSEWQTTNFSCYAVCSSPPAIENAAVFVQDNRAKYYCLTGYFAIENTVDIIECRNRIWPSPDFKCIKSCPDPPSIANANVMVSNNVALYSCHEGFLPKSGTSSIKCLQSEWQTTNFSCYAVCSSPPAIENAAVFVQGNRAKYCCLTGYFAIENTVDIIECSNRIWPSPDFKCLKSCPDPPSIANANVMVSNNVALYSCHEGFLPKSGTSSIKCLQSEWQTTNFSCYASSCGPLPNITNADFLVDNDVAMYACRYGFRPTNSDNKVTCVSGEWTYTSLKCQDTSNRQRSYVTNETLEEWIKKMKEDLYVNKSKTSVYNRSLISVYESRPSAVQLGSVGVFLISFMITALILPDIIALVKKVCHKLNKTFCYRRINQ